MEKSPTMRSAEKEAKQLHQKMIGERIKPILAILDADSLEDLSKVLKKPLEKPDMKELDPEQKMSAQEAEKKTLESMKKTAIAAAMKEIEEYIAPVRKDFGDDFPFVQDYTKVLDAIKGGDPKVLQQLKKQLGLTQ